MIRLWLRRIFGVAYIGVLLTLTGVGWALAILSPYRLVMVPFLLSLYVAIAFLIVYRHGQR
ncbi:MAG TPA: hypothetical protein VG055_30395 [Planctomycetaceae bacterium]|jgi:hypothetical protein|nr:hypothetical protein [Planctomycetaceae bacterium]